MHYYQFNIGDYRRDTQHLTILEHGIYRLLLDQYYLTEKPIDANALRLLCIRNADEVAIAFKILDEFFNECEHGKFEHKRARTEIEKFHEKSEKASKSAKLRWNANAMRTQCDGNANHKPITNNQEPLTNNHKPITKPSVSREKIAFDGSRFSGIEGYLPTWIDTYRAIDVPAEILKAASWLMANPKNTKSQYARFLNNWLARAQDKAPSARGLPDRPKNNSEKFNDAFRSVFGENHEPAERDITAIATRVD